MSLVPALVLLAAAVSLAETLPEQATVITNVTVVGPAGVVPGQSIVIAGDRILTVGPAPGTPPPDTARVFDGQGAFVIAGLWEMHGHLASYPGSLPLFVAYGVTGVRDMGNASPQETQELVQWRGEIAAHKRVGPRLVIAGPTVDGPRGYVKDTRLFVTTAADGRQAVDTVKERGADFVKVHDWIGPEAYEAVIEAARAKGMPVAGHTPAAIPARDAAEAGQRSIEHLGSGTGGFLLDVSRREKALRREVLQHMALARAAGSEKAFWQWVQSPAHSRALLESSDPAKAARLMAILKKHGTWHCPTLTVMSPTVRPRSDAEKRFVFASAQASCAKTPPPVVPSTAEALFRRQLGIVADLQRAGVGLLTGTDTSAPNQEAVDEFGTCDVPIAGLSVHDELEWLVVAGLTPGEALAAATLGPARYLKEEATAGSVAAGKRADLVLLEANPLEDIRNTRRIRAVVSAGRLFDRETLDGFLEQAATDAKAR